MKDCKKFTVLEEIRNILNNKVVLIDTFNNLPERAYIYPTDVDLTQMDPSDYWKIEYHNHHKGDNEIGASVSNFIRVKKPSGERNTQDENEELVFDLFQNLTEGLSYEEKDARWIKRSYTSGKCTI